MACFLSSKKGILLFRQFNNIPRGQYLFTITFQHRINHRQSNLGSAYHRIWGNGFDEFYQPHKVIVHKMIASGIGQISRTTFSNIPNAKWPIVFLA